MSATDAKTEEREVSKTMKQVSVIKLFFFVTYNKA
jgi:hypothetical protein